MKLSFCTTCMNRLYQLSQTLPQNLAAISEFSGVELCLVNFNSQDGLEDYIRQNFYPWIRTGHLKYFYTQEPRFFHLSKAKNLAHRLGSGEILYNLDADNFIHTNMVHEVLELFKEENIFIHDRTYTHPLGATQHNGSCGRIALSKNHFEQLRGYDEGLLSGGYEDNDLLLRLKQLNLTLRRTTTPVLPALLNDKRETVANQRFKSYQLTDMLNSGKVFLRNFLHRPVNPFGMQLFQGRLNFESDCVL